VRHAFLNAATSSLLAPASPPGAACAGALALEAYPYAMLPYTYFPAPG